MIWTKEAPTQTGWYWATDFEAEQIGHPVCVEVVKRSGEERLCVFIPGDEYDWSTSDFIHWLGPIDVPKLP